MPATRPFRRNDGGEQIDGAFELDGWHYIVECRWRETLSNIQQLDSLYGKVGRSGKQTMGLFLSVNGWSQHVVPLVKQNPDKSILLMEGFDLRTVLAQPFSLRELLRAKSRALNLEAEPLSFDREASDLKGAWVVAAIQEVTIKIDKSFTGPVCDYGVGFLKFKLARQPRNRRTHGDRDFRQARQALRDSDGRARAGEIRRE